MQGTFFCKQKMEKFLGVQIMTKSKVQMRAGKQWLSVSW